MTATHEPSPAVDHWANVTVVVLAGGMGSRLRSVVSDRPKVLAEVNGRPFLAFLLDDLVSAGAQRIVLSTGFMADRVEAAFGSAYRDIPIEYCQESVPLGTGGGLRMSARSVETDSLLVLNGDSYCKADLSAFLSTYHAAGKIPTVMLVWGPDTSRFGEVTLSSESKIVAFREKHPPSGPGWINAGIYALPTSLVRSIPSQGPVSLERDVFPDWVVRGMQGHTSDGPFLDIGTPESFQAAAEFFSARSGKLHT